MTHRVLATPKMIEESRLLLEAAELQYRILKTKCDQALAERDELVSFKVVTQKRIEELEERRAVFELKYPSELDVDAITHQLEALPPLDDSQIRPLNTKPCQISGKKNLQTALRQVWDCDSNYSHFNHRDFHTNPQAASVKALLFQQLDAFRDIGISQAPNVSSLTKCEQNLQDCLANVLKTNG
jgi:hypothetical protein